MFHVQCSKEKIMYLMHIFSLHKIIFDKCGITYIFINPNKSQSQMCCLECDYLEYKKHHFHLANLTMTVFIGIKTFSKNKTIKKIYI